MKTKLLRSLMTAVCLFLFIAAAKGYQTNEILNRASSQDNVSLSSLQQDSIIPLNCTAPIDPTWLKKAREGVAGKFFDEPTVRVAYLIPSNRSPQAKGVEALQKVIREGRDFFKNEMTYNGHTSKTFRYETEADGETPLIHVINIPETDAEIEEANQGNHFANKVNAARRAGLSVWNQGEIWVLVSESHRQLPNSSILAGGALGGSVGGAGDPGVGTMTSTFLTPFAEDGLTNNRVYNGLLIPEIGPYPLRHGISFASFDGPTISSIASVTLGAFLHELMHAFGIGHHDFRNDRNFHGNLMGNGFRGIRGHLYPDKYPGDYTRLAFASALTLSTNHYFNTGKQRNQVDEVTFSLQSSTPKDGKLVFNFTAYDDDGLSMLQLFGIPDLSVEQGLYGLKYFNGQIMTPYFEPGTQTNFILKLYDKQGNKTERSIMVTPTAGSNRAPWPFLQIRPAIGKSGDSFQLDASLSRDPENNYPITFEWDYNFDDRFDTDPTQSPLITKNFSGGNHLIRLKVTESSGASTISTPMTLHVVGDVPPQAEVDFTLIDADTDKEIPGFDPIPEGAELNFSSFPSKLSIRANVPDHYESVRFDFNGQKNFRIENVEPYSLFGDIQGDYNSGADKLLFPPVIGNEASHTLSATPFSQDGARGTAGTKGVLRFSTKAKPIIFTLVDADTNEDLYNIENGMRISSFSILNKNLNIRTSHETPREDLKVHFKLTGPIDQAWTEHHFPFALFGDIQGNYNGVQLPAGTYNLKADFEFKFAQCCESSQLSTQVTFEIEETRVNHFTIFAPTPYEREGTEFNESGLIFPPSSTPLTIKAFIRGEVGSVEIGISGPLTSSRIENVFPYSLFGDSDGIFASRVFPEGDYELTATPYREPDGQGMAGKSLTVAFSIGFDDNYSLNGAGLYDADSLNFLDELLSADDGNSTLRSLVDNATIILNYDCINYPCPESVFMALNGPVTSSRIENEEPFSLFGDQNGDFVGQSLPVGDYRLTFTPYTHDNGMGTAGRTTSVDFSIVDTFLAKNPVALLYPNPAHDNVMIKTATQSEFTGHAIIYDFLGREVKRVQNFDPAVEQRINVSNLSPGIYFVKIYNGSAVETKKMVVQ